MVQHYLIAEDDKNLRLLIQQAYSSLGLQDVAMHYVEDGQEAIDYLEGTGRFADRSMFPLPSVVLLDFKMPRKNGLDVLSWVRQSSLKEMVVVVFSGSDAERDVHHAYQFGANSFIPKPNSFSDLKHVLSVIHHYWFGFNYIPKVGGGIIGRAQTPFRVVAREFSAEGK